MRIVAVAAAAAAALLLSTGPASAQSLSELAAKEKERRSKAKAGKMYTETDLGRGSSVAPAAEAASDAKPADAPADAAKPEAARKEKTEDELKVERQTAWREKVVKTTADISRLQARADLLQTALNDLSQNLYGSTRQSQAAELEQVQGQLGAARKTLEDLQEEGRRNSYR